MNFRADLEFWSLQLQNLLPWLQPKNHFLVLTVDRSDSLSLQLTSFPGNNPKVAKANNDHILLQASLCISHVCGLLSPLSLHWLLSKPGPWANLFSVTYSPLVPVSLTCHWFCLASSQPCIIPASCPSLVPGLRALQKFKIMLFIAFPLFPLSPQHPQD